MKELIGEIIYWFKDYYADSMYILFAFFACIYLITIERKKYQKIVISTLLTFFTITNPILYLYVFRKVIFWRLFWMIPCVLLIGLALMELVGGIKVFWKKVVLCFCVLLFVVLSGNNAFIKESKGEKSNPYGLSQSTIDVADIMLKYDETPRCIISKDFISQIRLYNGNIEPMYGRNAEGFINFASDEVKVMYSVMESETPDYTYVLSRAQHWGYNFIVNTDSRPISEKDIKRYGYKLIDSVDGYNIYYNSELNDTGLEGYEWKHDSTGWWYENTDGEYLKQTIKEINGITYYFNREGYVVENLNGEIIKNIGDGDLIVTQFGDDSLEKPSMCYTIDDQEGHFVIIDGGNLEDTETVLHQIWMYGGKVDAWILTHPHSDHIGAFNEIYEKYKDDIEIDRIYAIDIDSDYYKDTANEWDEIEYFNTFNDLINDKTNPNYGNVEFVERDKTYSIGNMSFKVYNTFTDESYEISTGSLPNACSMVFELFGNNESFLFLGDLEQGNADLIEKKYGSELCADYIQAAHHGQNIEFAFYDNLLNNCKAVTVDAPYFLRQYDPDFHTSYEHIDYFKSKKVDIYSFETTPNIIIVK